jgi:triacylglycerol lipase
MAKIGAVVLAGGVTVTIGTVIGCATRRRTTDRAAPLVLALRESVVDVASHPAFIGTPSRAARRAAAVLRGVTAVTDVLGVDFSTQITPLIASPHPPSWLMAGVHVHRDIFQGWPVYVLTSKDERQHNSRVVALHGGAYVVEPTVNHWAAYAEIARRNRCAVVIPIYPLASTPQGRAATVIPALADFLTMQVRQHGDDNIAVYGDSAGGAMALAAAQILVETGRATPRSMVLISPWLDATMTNPAINAIDDPVLRSTSLRTAGQQWAGTLALTDPLVSPLYGSMTGLPPTTIYCGNRELFAADVLRLRQQAESTPGHTFTFVLRDGAIHDWAMGGLFATPESVAVQHQVYKQIGLVTG